MDTKFIMGIIEIIIGLLVNIFIGKLGIIIFRKDNRLSRVILRTVGIFLLINGISIAFNI